MRTGMVVGLKHKLQPRSQSLGSLSVKTNSNQLAKYEPITNPLRMAASVEANHCYGLHVDTEFDDIGTVIVFGKSKDKDKPLPRLRRTQISMLCLDEETVLTNHHHHHQHVSHTNNNNNIYADLEINCKNNQQLGDSESLKSDEVAEHGVTQVEIEINVLEKKEVPVEVQIENSIFELDAQAMPPINSIDRYLDKIDTLNRVLDDRFKRQLPSLPSKELDSLDTIEIADNSEIVKRAKDEHSASSKRTSSSSSDSRFKEVTNQIAKFTKVHQRHFYKH